MLCPRLFSEWESFVEFYSKPSAIELHSLLLRHKPWGLGAVEGQQALEMGG